jgi:hypothetical protein
MLLGGWVLAFFHPEFEGRRFLQILVVVYQITRRYISKNWTLKILKMLFEEHKL